MKVVHFVTDEKFIDSAIELTDVLGGTHEFVTLECAPTQDWKQVRQWDRVHQVRPKTPEWEALLKREDTLFVLHSRTDQMMDFCLHLKNRHKHGNAILWITWGHDYHDLIHPRDYGPKTDALFHQYWQSIWKPRPKLVRLLAKPIRQLQKLGKRVKCNRFLKLVDFYPCLLPAERNLFRALFRKEAIEISEGGWSYYLDSPQLPEAKPFTAFSAKHPPRILFNHSAASENNHIDGLYAIAPFLLPNQRITVPLNYKCFRAETTFLRRLLPTLPGGDRLDFLEKWLPLEEWWKEIAACDIFIQSARRQIANGATTAALAFGKKVFLSEKNPFLSYFRDLGVRIFSLEHDLGPTAFSTPLTQEEAERNIHIIREKYMTSREAKIEDAKRFFSFIEAHMPQRVL